MAVTLDTIHKQLKQLRDDVCFLRHAMEEDDELSEATKRDFAMAQKTPRSEYIKHEVVKKTLLE